MSQFLSKIIMLALIFGLGWVIYDKIWAQGYFTAVNQCRAVQE